MCLTLLPGLHFWQRSYASINTSFFFQLHSDYPDNFKVIICLYKCEVNIILFITPSSIQMLSQEIIVYSSLSTLRSGTNQVGHILFLTKIKAFQGFSRLIFSKIQGLLTHFGWPDSTKQRCCRIDFLRNNVKIKRK